MAAFYRLAAVVGAFTRHMSDVNTVSTESGEYENVCRHMQNCTLQSDRGEFQCENTNKFLSIQGKLKQTKTVSKRVVLCK